MGQWDECTAREDFRNSFGEQKVIQQLQLGGHSSVQSSFEHVNVLVMAPISRLLYLGLPTKLPVYYVDDVDLFIMNSTLVTRELWEEAACSTAC
jgi:hypothetical protein